MNFFESRKIIVFGKNASISPMNRDAISETTAGTYNINESVFIENQGITIKGGNSKLIVESCLFLKCSKSAASSIELTGSGNSAIISKICGRSCFLTSEGQYGILYQLCANQVIDQVSFYDHTSNIKSRDVLNHETGNQLIESVNVSHINNYLRGFAWFSPKDGNNLVFNFGVGYNITCYCDVLSANNGNDIFNHLCLVSCTSLSVSVPYHNAGNYMFSTKDTTTLRNCLIRNNKFPTLFNGNPKLISCDIDEISADFLNTNFIDMNAKHKIYLNTFVCKASGILVCMKTIRIYKGQPNNTVFQIIILIAS